MLKEIERRLSGGMEQSEHSALQDELDETSSAKVRKYRKLAAEAVMIVEDRDEEIAVLKRSLEEYRTELAATHKFLEQYRKANKELAMQLDGVRRKGKRAFGNVFSGLRKRSRVDRLSTVDEGSTDQGPYAKEVTPASTVSDKENLDPTSIDFSSKSVENTEQVGTTEQAAAIRKSKRLQKRSRKSRSPREHATPT